MERCCGMGAWARHFTRSKHVYARGVNACVKHERIFQLHIPTTCKVELKNVELHVRITTCKGKGITRKDGYM